MSWPDSSLPTPERQLVGFERINLDVAQEDTVMFQITAEQMGVWDDKLGWVVQPGKGVSYFSQSDVYECLSPRTITFSWHRYKVSRSFSQILK